MFSELAALALNEKNTCYNINVRLICNKTAEMYLHHKLQLLLIQHLSVGHYSHQIEMDLTLAVSVIRSKKKRSK